MSTDLPIPVSSLCGRYLRHASRTFLKDGKPTSHVGNVLYAMRSLRDAGKGRGTDQFAAPELARLRDALVVGRRGGHLALATVNKRLGIIKEAFAWGREYGYVTAQTLADLQIVAPPRRGRTLARDPQPVPPVDRASVDAALPYLPQVIRDMIELLWLQGCRPQEVCAMCGAELETGCAVWLHRPRRYKTQHVNKRQLPNCLGPQAQAIVKRYLARYVSAPFFHRGRRRRSDSPGDSRARVRAGCRDSSIPESQTASPICRIATPRARCAPPSIAPAIRRISSDGTPTSSDMPGRRSSTRRGESTQRGFSLGMRGRRRRKFTPSRTWRRGCGWRWSSDERFARDGVGGTTYAERCLEPLSAVRSAAGKTGRFGIERCGNVAAHKSQRVRDIGMGAHVLGVVRRWHASRDLPGVHTTAIWSQRSVSKRGGEWCAGRTRDGNLRPSDNATVGASQVKQSRSVF